MDDTKVIGGIGLLTVAVVAAIVIFGSKTNVPDIVPATVEEGQLVRDDSQASGPADATVTLVEFGDLQCPACGAEHPILKSILQDYEGKIRFVFRHFPLSIHANAQLASRAAEAAGAQGKFWEFHDLLYERQDDWSYQLKPQGKFESYAAELGLNLDQFKQDEVNAALADKIAQDMGDGDALGVNATPTLYVNGEKLESGADAVVRAKLDEALR